MSKRLEKLTQHLQPSIEESEININSCTQNYEQNNITWQNWAETVECKPSFIHHPTSLNEIQNILETARTSKQKVKVTGVGHSPSDIACTTDHMIFLDKMNQIIEVNRQQKTITVEGGTTLHDINRCLEKNNMALPLLLSISEPTIGGVLAIGAHGTGLKYSGFSNFVLSLEIIGADGNLQFCDRNTNVSLFRSALCHLGVLGIIYTVKLQCVSGFSIEAFNSVIPFNQVIDQVHQNINSSQYYRFWWIPHTEMCVQWKANSLPNNINNNTNSNNNKNNNTNKNNDINQNNENNENLEKNRKEMKKLNLEVQKASTSTSFLNYEVLEFLLYISTYFPSILPFVNKFYQKITFNSNQWICDDSVKMFNFNCLFKQFVSEWNIPIENTKPALLALKNLIQQKNYKVHFPVEVRFEGKDTFPLLGPSNQRDSCYIGIIMYKPYQKHNIPHQVSYFKDFEKLMASFGGRPHWAKDFSWNYQQFQKEYIHWNQFLQIRNQQDPQRIFQNQWSTRVLGD